MNTPIRKEVDSKEISKLFGMDHKKVLRSIRDIISKNKMSIPMFKESLYTSEQNKKLTMFVMGVEGFCLLSELRSYSNGKSANVKANLLNEFGVKFSVVGSGHSRLECDYYDILKRVFNQEEIVREFYISGYRSDFYFPEYDIHVEYDEEGHFSKETRERDKLKEKTIRLYYFEEFDDFTKIIRVKKGEEYESLSVIMGCISDFSSDDCFKYYEEWESNNGEKNNIRYVEGLFYGSKK